MSKESEWSSTTACLIAACHGCSGCGWGSVSCDCVWNLENEWKVKFPCVRVCSACYRTPAMDPYLNWNVLLLVHCAYHNGITLLLPPPSLPIPHACCMWRGFGVAPGTSAACCKTLPNCKMLIHLCITYWCRCVTCSLQVWSCVVCRYLFFFPNLPFIFMGTPFWTSTVHPHKLITW